MLGTSEKTTKYGVTNTHSFSLLQLEEVVNIYVAKEFSMKTEKNTLLKQLWRRTLFWVIHVITRVYQQRACPSFLKLPYL